MNKIVKSEQEWRELLSDLAFAVTREGATERPFSGTLLHNNQQGTYHCICCNQTLFSSQAKFDAGCGWPSFFKPDAEGTIDEKEDLSFGP